GKHGGHEKRGPIDGVETNDVLADEMQIGGPVAALFVFGATNGAEIRSKRIEPDVEDVRLFAGHGNAPANGGAGDAEVFQTAFNEADDFVLAGFRLDEIGILAIEVEQRLLKGGELEEIVFFRDGFERASAIRTVVARFRVVHEGVVVNAVLAGIMTFINVAV